MSAVASRRVQALRRAAFSRGQPSTSNLVGFAMPAPRRTIAAWRRGSGARNLYGAGLDHDELMDWTVEALAAWMRVESAIRSASIPSPPP